MIFHELNSRCEVRLLPDLSDKEGKRRGRKEGKKEGRKEEKKEGNWNEMKDVRMVRQICP